MSCSFSFIRHVVLRSRDGLVPFPSMLILLIALRMLSLVSKSTQADPVTILPLRTTVQLRSSECGQHFVISKRILQLQRSTTFRHNWILWQRFYYIPLTQTTKNISLTDHRPVELTRELKQTTTTAKMRRHQHLAILAICCDLIRLLENSKNKPGDAQVSWHEGWTSLVKARLTEISDSRIGSERCMAKLRTINIWSSSSLSVLISVVADLTVLWNPWQVPLL